MAELPMELFGFSDKNVSFVKTDKVLIIGIAPAKEPYKPFALAIERDRTGKETGWYTVPKSLVYAHRAEKLADGSRLNVMRTKEVPFADRKALYDKYTKEGLKVRPVEEKEAKPKRPALTLDAMMDQSIPVNPLHVKL